MTKKMFKAELKTLITVVIFTFIYGASVIWFLDHSVPQLYTGGIPGVSQVVRSFFVVYFNIDFGNIFIGLFTVVLNIPIMVLGYFGVSKRFTIYSTISVLVQATMFSFIPKIDFGITDPLSLAILGGMLSGVGIGGALKYGSSTGGLDIVAQYMSLKRGITVGYMSLILNLLIAVAGGIIYKDGAVTAYTVIRIIITTLTTDKIHTAYNFLKVEIISDLSHEISKEVLVKLYRGITMVDVTGAYSGTERHMLVVVISTYELTNLKQISKFIDPNAFIIVQPVRHLYGNFKRKTIV